MSLLTKEKILNEANQLMRSRGYSAFSYADLSKKIGITKASIHHHFPTKDVLGLQVVLRAISNAESLFDKIEQEQTSVHDKLSAYMDVFIEGYHMSELPLCCALSAEMEILPDSIKEETKSYFELQIKWLSHILTQGVDIGEINTALSPQKTALIIINIFEGASVVARATRNPELFKDSLGQIMLLLAK